MSAYYFEGSPILAPLTFMSKDVVVSSETVTLKRLIHKTNAQRWDLSFSITTNDNSDNLLLGMIENSYTLKTMDMPQLTKVADATTMTGTLTCTQTFATGQTTIGANNSSGGVLPKGSFVQFSNHTKIYIIKEDYTFNGDALEVYPELKAGVTGSTTVYYDNFSIKPQLNYMRDDSEASGITFIDGVLASLGTVTIKEVV